jgi:hypothetical protein
LQLYFVVVGYLPYFCLFFRYLSKLFGMKKSISGLHLRYVLIALCLIVSFFQGESIAQIITAPVNPTTLPLDTLIRRLVGPGVTISNITSNIGQNNQAYGSFRDNTLVPVTGIKRGLIMTTGNVNVAPGPNGTIGQTGTPNPGGTPFPPLAAIATGSINDVCLIQFNFVPFGDTIKFSYVFGSEEYPNFSCSNFNDVFGFFVSGPNPLGGNYVSQNIARIPNTNIPVAINNVTNGGCGGTCPANQAFFIANFNQGGCTPGTINIGYDGFTVKLDAVIPVVKCQTYTLALAIADVSDSVLDSFVILENGSFQALNADIDARSSFDRFDYAIEGCNPGEFVFKRLRPDTADLKVFWEIDGTAANGIDYTDTAGQPIKNFITIPGNQDSAVLTVVPLLDTVSDPLETMILRVYTPCDDTASNNPRGDTIILQIREEFEYETTSDVDVCGSDSALINPTPFLASDSILWTPPIGLSCTNCLTPNAYPPVTTTYRLTVFDSLTGCRGSDTITVFVYQPIIPNVPSVCPGDVLALTAGGGSVPLQYLWKSHPTISSVLTQQTISVTADSTRYYSVRVTYPLGCVRFDSFLLVVAPPPIVANVDTSLCFAEVLQLNLTNSLGDSLFFSRPLDSLVFDEPTFRPRFVVPGRGTYIFTGGIRRGTCVKNFGVRLRMYEEMKPEYDVLLKTDELLPGTPITLKEAADLPLPFKLDFIRNMTPLDPIQNYWRIQFTGASRRDTIIRERDIENFEVREPGDYRISLVTFQVKGTDPGDTCTEIRTDVLSIKPFVPNNVLTSNGDGKNDVLYLRGLDLDAVISVRINNRWGRLVYSSPDYKDDWKADDVEAGVYYYQAKNESDGSTYSGWVNVLK